MTFAPARDGTVVVRTFSGPRQAKQGETLSFDIDLNLTPSKPIATDQKWRDRIVHPAARKIPPAPKPPCAILRPAERR